MGFWLSAAAAAQLVPSDSFAAAARSSSAREGRGVGPTGESEWFTMENASWPIGKIRTPLLVCRCEPALSYPPPAGPTNHRARSRPRERALGWQGPNRISLWAPSERPTSSTLSIPATRRPSRSAAGILYLRAICPARCYARLMKILFVRILF